MVATSYLIVNADDFGQSSGVNQGIIEAYERGIVTSSSLMVRWPAAVEAAYYSRENPNLSLGLHVDLGEWYYLNDNWTTRYEVVPIEDNKAVKKEVQHQLTVFRDLVGKDPTHIDSHQHVHNEEPLRSILLNIAKNLGVPLRNFYPKIRYCGNFYGQTQEGETYQHGIAVDGLIKILKTLRPGITEISCHPGESIELETAYTIERATEVKTLCDPIVCSTVMKMEILLCSFADLTQIIND